MKKIFHFHRQKKDSSDLVIVPRGIDYRYVEGDESEKPVLLIAFMTSENEATVVAVDAGLASQLTATLNNSPMKMFIRTEKEKRDMMYN
ncbi:MAG: hypothetical protein II855_02540 [Candidatus Methanomethylophilaceae archaeon]|nr:hypothetical protein [Candidatus Methanomethylophilaceae archaeon]